VGANGLDVARAMYLDLTAQPVPQDNQVEGRKFIVEDRDMLSAHAAYRQGALRLRDWVRSLGGVKEGAWFALDDPLPFFKQGFHHLTPIINRIMAR
jgi:predicted ATP-grasp superfamily ATP-dependent carboligase